MYVIMQKGAHQHKVWPGQFLKVEKIKLSVGASWECREILAFQDKEGLLKTGKPYIEKALLTAQIIRQGKSKKKLVFKKKRRKGYRKTCGHRQEFTEIYISGFHGPNGESLKKPLKKKVLSSSSAKTPVPAKEEKSS